MGQLDAHTDAVIRRAAEALVAEGAREVYVFGSFSRGDSHPDSDLDLAVRGLPPERFFRALARASRAAGRDVDVVVMEEDGPLIRFLDRKGELRRVA